MCLMVSNQIFTLTTVNKNKSKMHLFSKSGGVQWERDEFGNLMNDEILDLRFLVCLSFFLFKYFLFRNLIIINGFSLEL